MLELIELQRHLHRLAHHLARGDVFTIMTRVAQITPVIGAIHVTPAPTSPEGRAKWDRYAEPCREVARRCETLARTMPWPVGVRRVTWSPLWLVWFLADVQMYLRLPGLDDLFTAAAGPTPVPPITSEDVRRAVQAG